MNDKKWFIPYILLFFLIFIPTTFFLFSGDHLKFVPHRVTIVSFGPNHSNHLSSTQSVPNDPADCINDLYNKFQSGMLDLNSLSEGIDRCFNLNSNNDDNNSLTVPQPQPPVPQPQLPTSSMPRFV